MSRRALPLGLAALALSGCTYTSTLQRVVDLPAEERVARVIEVLEETPDGAPVATAAPGPVPGSLSIALAAPRRDRCRVVVARRTPREVREAEATFVPSRRVLKHVLGFSLGVAVFAPVWLPLHYHGCASDRAEAALGDPSLAGTHTDEGGGCYVTRVDTAKVASEWVEDGAAVERDLRREGPLRGAAVQVRRQEGPWAWRGRTDGLGRIVVTRAALGPSSAPLEVEVAGATVVVPAPAAAWAPVGPPSEVLRLEADVSRDGLEAVVRRIAAAVGSGALGPDAPEARALPALLRRRGGPLPLAAAARPELEAAARELGACADAPGSAELASVRAHLEAALRAAPACWEAHRLLGTTARLTGDEPTATRHLRVALALLPETSPLADRVAADLVGR